MNKTYSRMSSIFENKGITTIELIVVISIIGILAAAAVNSYSNSITNKRLESAANQIYADLKLAKSEAKAKNKTIFVSFKGTGKNWCYGINEETACNCKKPDSCLLNESEKIYNSVAFKDINLQKARFAGGGSSTAFDPKRGFAVGNGVKNGTIWLKADNDNQLAVIVNRLGRVRFCSPQLAGYSKSCPTPP